MRTTIALVLSLVTLSFSACSGGSSSTDGGRRDGGRDGGLVLTPPNVAITASPAQGQTGQEVTFTAAITGGTQPYVSCNWRFEAGADQEAGELSGGTCFGRHTYTMNGDWVVTVEVQDTANRTGTASVSFNVGGGGTTTGVDLQVTPNSIQLVNPPTNNRYQPGGQLSVSFSVRNNLLGNAAASVARVSVKAIGQSEVVLGDVNVNALGPQASQQVSGTFTIPANSANGSYDLIVTADATNAITEEVETNNVGKLLGAFAVQAGDGGF